MGVAEILDFYQTRSWQEVGDLVVYNSIDLGFLQSEAENGKPHVFTPLSMASYQLFPF